MTAKRRWRFWLTLGIGGGIAFFGGCANDSDDDGQRISIQNFPAAFANALCSNIGPCCQLEGYVVDSAACEATAYCDYTVPRQCVLRKARGEPCGFDEQCAATDDCSQTCRGRTLASKDNCM
jgi:hypothetical protein